MDNIINIGMSDIAFGGGGQIFRIVGLGSCVALTIYDTDTGYSAMAHVMLPKSTHTVPKDSSPGKFADTAVNYIIGKYISEGISISSLRAKIAGGSCMFRKIEGGKLNIGEKNTLSIKKILKNLNIPLVAEDTGGSHGRTVEFYPDSKKLVINSHRFGKIII